MADELVLEGKTTVDDKMVFEPQRLSYDAARTIAEKIARRIFGRTRDRHVVIAGMQLLADLSNVVAVKSILEELAGEYDALGKAVHASIPVAPYATYTTRTRSEYVQLAASPFEALSVGVKGGLALLSLFRQDVDYKGVPVSIDTLGFELELAARIRMHKAREVVVPDFAVFNAPEAGATALRALTEKVKTARFASIQAIVAKWPKSPRKLTMPVLRPLAERDDEHAEHDNDEHEHAESAAPPAPNLDAITEVLGQIDQRFNDLQSQLAKMDTDGSGLTMLSRLYRAETINAHAPLLVHVRVLLAGGSNRISRSFFRTIFTGDGLSSTGGAVVSWAILSERGAIEDGGVLTESMSAASPKPPETPPSIP